MDSTVNKGRFQGRKGGQARKPTLEEVEGSMEKWKLADFAQINSSKVNNIRCLREILK